MAKKLLTDQFSEPLDGAANAVVRIDAAEGNLSVGSLPRGEPLLARGALEYYEGKGQPARSLVSRRGEACLTLKGGRAGRPWLRMPWAACNGANHWSIQLNPGLPTDLTAHSGGGNILLDLCALALTHLQAETGGGNIHLDLPDHCGGLSAEARSGAGNVSATLPAGLPARVHATTGLGKVLIDPPFVQVDRSTYETPGFAQASERAEITLKSGAGNVILSTR
jgi:hypothetical protein